MAHNDFDNNIQSRFQSFESTPPESVWTNISNFRDRRRKRLLFFWWFIPTVLIATSTMVFFSIEASSINRLEHKHKNTKSEIFKTSIPANTKVPYSIIETTNTSSLTSKSSMPVKKAFSSVKSTSPAAPNNSEEAPEGVKIQIDKPNEIILERMLSLALTPEKIGIEYTFVRTNVLSFPPPP